VATGRLLWQAKGHKGGVNFLSFSPDGKTLASGGLEGDVRLWEAATGKERLFNLVTLLEPGLLRTARQQLMRVRQYYADLRSELVDQSRRGRPAADAESRLAQRRAALDREEQQRLAELRQKSTLHVPVSLLQ
jgi:hypothetical protein